MRILSIGNFGRGWDGSVCDEEHIAKALEDLGHEVVRCQRGEVHFVDITTEFDFVLLAQWDGYDEAFIPLMRGTIKSPLVYWAFDYQTDGQAWHERLIREADLYLSKRIADAKYPNWQWLSQDFAPDFLDRYDGEVEKDIDVLFTGSYLPWATERNEIIKAVNERFNLVVHSVNNWPFLERRPPVMDEGLSELYARAKVILSIDHTIEAGYWSDRNAQIMACGGLVLFRYVPLSEARFINGTCVAVHSKEHFLDELHDLLERAEEDLDGIRETGYQWAHRNLMVGHRVNDLITIVEGVL